MWKQEVAVEFRIKFVGSNQIDGRSQQKQMIQTYLRVISATWFKEDEFLGRELMYASPMVLPPDE